MSIQNGVSKDIQNLTEAENAKNNYSQLEELLKKNLELTQEMYEMTKKIKKYINLQRIFSIIYILIILVPIVLSIIYLPPLLNNMFSPWMEILGDDKKGIDISNFNISELEKLLK